jgi:hypothetical protein
MNLDLVTTAASDAATASERELASHVLVVYLAPDGGGMWIHRVGYPTAVIGGPDADGDFAQSCDEAIGKLWPELSRKARLKLKIAADLVGRTGAAKMLAGAFDDDDTDGG